MFEIALDDLRAAEKNPKLTVFMGDWHTAQDNGVCVVCLAGAVMHTTYLASPAADLTPRSFDDNTARRLTALNTLRTGYIRGAWLIMSAANQLENLPAGIIANWDICDYDTDRDTWWEEATELLTYLKSKNI